MWPRSIGGGTERRSRFGQQTNQAVTDENSVVFWTAQQQAFEWLRDAVEHAMHAVTIGPAPSAAAAPDPVAQLRQLADLHRAAGLTDHEFAQANQSRLRRLR
jgi:hypothetical protein